jgi:site-specific recombinase XerD
MFEQLFHYPQVLARQVHGPWADERKRYLTYRAQQGTPHSTLLRWARELLVVASKLALKVGVLVSRSTIQNAAHRWALQQRRQGRAHTLQWSEQLFIQTANAWLAFLGWLQPDPDPPPPYETQWHEWSVWLEQNEGLAETTVRNYGWWARQWLQWLESRSLALSQVTWESLDTFMRGLGTQGLSRVTLATAAKALRRFLAYAYQQSWCPKDGGGAILAPRLFHQEELPAGPEWTDVQRLLAHTDTEAPRDIRNRAVLLLFAVYALRRGEVARLRLQDVDWQRRVLHVQRSKSGRRQEYPLTRELVQALRRYVRQVRPSSPREELFLTLHAPFRPLSGGALYDLTGRLFQQLNIVSRKHGPHALRHACATHLLNRGLSLKQIGDHLGHQNLGTTQVYAKVDLAGLREVASFDLGGLL